MLVKLDHFPRVRGENKIYLSCHRFDVVFYLIYLLITSV